MERSTAERAPQHWNLPGSVENWGTGIERKVWGMKPHFARTWERLTPGDTLFFYVAAPVAGVVGYGRVLTKFQGDAPLWPDEIKAKRIMYPYRFEFDVARLLEPSKWVEARVPARDNAFRTDPRLPIDQNATCDDYGGSGGHMVPRSDMNRALIAMVNTFFLTNMTPQYPNVNQGTWARLEDWVRAWAQHFGAVHVISGSVFDDDDNEVPDEVWLAQLSQVFWGAAVPSHYYKVILREQPGGQVEAITLFIPNRAQGVPGRNASDATKDQYLRQRIRTLAEIRRRTGLDLLPSFPAFQKQALEQAVASDLWPRN